MKIRLIKAITLIICLTMTTPVVAPDIGVETVEAAEYDWLFDEDEYDYLDDEDNYNYENVNKTYDIVLVSQSIKHNYSFTSLKNGMTNIYPINIEETTDYIVGFTERSYSEQSASILIVDAVGNNIFEKDLFLYDDGWKETLSLSEGKYYIKILSKDVLGFDYELYIEPKVMIKNEIEKNNLKSYDKETLYPELGKGNWETSDENVIGIISKNSDNSSTCKVEARKSGKATITYTNDKGSVIKYEFTVSAIKNGSKNLKISSCDNKELKSKVGKGKWKTSNKNIIEIISKNSDYNSTCKVRAKKVGKATITYTDQYGYVMKYNFTVSAKKTYPLDNAYFSMDSAGGLEPTIFIANNSDKKIKYIYLTVSFYNSVGDKLRNDIGWYSDAKLKITGYIKPWESTWYEWDPVFYEYSASKMKIETMQIVYSDGSKKNMKINKKYSIR